jgi:hypothetical protein
VLDYTSLMLGGDKVCQEVVLVLDIYIYIYIYI